MLLIGSAAGTAKQAVDDLRAKGKKVGVIKLRLFRPFPADELATALKGAKAVASWTVQKVITETVDLLEVK